MSNNLFNHSIAPRKVIRGKDAFNQSVMHIKSICKNPLIIGRSLATNNIRNTIQRKLQESDLNIINFNLKYDCCEIDLKEGELICRKNKCDSIIAIGGGKVLDAGKLIADRLSLACITIPTSSATCAGWTSLSNIYSPNGAFVEDRSLRSCPELLIFDHGIVKKAPKNTLASGIADALAKWYEASLTSNASSDGLVQQAVQMARVLRDQLFIDGIAAYQNPESEEWIRVAEGCALTAGLIGGIGGAKCRTAAAHAIHNGITQLKDNSKLSSLHGEIVGVGILAQLRLEEIVNGNQLASQAREQLYKLLKSLNLPTSLIDLGIDHLNTEEINKICKFSLRENSDIHHLPFSFNNDILKQSILTTKVEKILHKQHIN